MRINYSNNKGFTLVEIAIVLVIIGLLVGLGSAMMGPLLNLSKTRESKESIGAVVESLNSWAASNNSIPNTAGFATVAKTSIDAWGRNLIYIYDNNLYAAAPTKDTICGRKTSNLTIINNGVTPAATTNNVAYLVISQGDDAVTQTTLNGTLNGAAINGIITGSGYATGTVTLDANVSDIVKWVTLDELRTKIGCQGAQLKILNNELPPGTVGSPYPSATVGAVLSFGIDGGATPGTFRWCVEAATAAPLPAGIIFNPLMTGAIRTPPATSCNGTTPLPEGSWISYPTLSISGTPAAGTSGAYNFTVYVRDNNDATYSNDNVASKSFIITIYP